MTEGGATPAVKEIRLTGVRGMIAERMVSSLAETAQVTFHADADVTALVGRRAAWKDAGLRISIEDCVVASLARTLALHPHMNGVVEGDRALLSEAVHVAIAVAANGMLMTPVLQDAHALDLPSIAAARRELVELVRVRKLPISKAKGGTTTVSNLGGGHISYFTPILNAGQLTILGVGKISAYLEQDADGVLVTRQRIGLSLTVDHRFVDGEPASRMLSDLCGALEAIDVAI